MAGALEPVDVTTKRRRIAAAAKFETRSRVR
jgi:hypothetical protein